MKTHSVLNLVWFAILGAILGFSSPAHAAGDPLINQARDQLHQALNPGGNAPSDADKTALLKSALTFLQKSPAIYRGQRKRAIEDVTAALFELGRGDPDHKTNDYIRKALDEVRDIT
jgi:hypothetical protein